MLQNQVENRMNEEQPENDLSKWFSSYGLITVERLIERYHIHLNQADLLKALSTPGTFYHQLMQLPLRNVFNGIIFQQARDYQVYAQKLYIDYLISGESGKDPAAPGSGTREDIENERNALVKLGEQFHELELSQEKLISDSQTLLIKHASAWIKAQQQVVQVLHNQLQNAGFNLSQDKVGQILSSLLVQYDLNHQSADGHMDWSSAEALVKAPLSADTKAIFIEHLAELQRFNSASDEHLLDFEQQVATMGAEMKRFRSQFQEAIVKANNLLKQLPDYHVDEAQNEINRQELYFDPKIGSDD